MNVKRILKKFLLVAIVASFVTPAVLAGLVDFPPGGVFETVDHKWCIAREEVTYESDDANEYLKHSGERKMLDEAIPMWAFCGYETEKAAVDDAAKLDLRKADEPAPAAEAPKTPVATEAPPAPEATEAPKAQEVASCTFSTPGDENAMPKTIIELAPQNAWFHRVFNPRLFHAPNWDGADSWFVSLALGTNSGGAWTSYGNPGQVVYRATSTSITWCLGILTNSTWKSQFLAGANDIPVGINIRIAPESLVTVVTSSGKVVSQATSDMGDITVILPDSGVVTISVDYTTAAPTHESLVWWGPYDRSANINTVDAR